MPDFVAKGYIDCYLLLHSTNQLHVSLYHDFIVVIWDMVP